MPVEEHAPRGLPGRLPPGERLLWQGSPDAAALTRAAFHTRAVGVYFGLWMAVALATAVAQARLPVAALVTALGGIAAVALLRLIGWAAARGAVYTLTDRRIVLRVGVALPKSVNLPLARIAAIDLSSGGDVSLRLTDPIPLGWLVLWPHARPWRLARPEPMLRCLPDAADVAERIGRACLVLQQQARTDAPTTAPLRAATPETVAA